MGGRDRAVTEDEQRTEHALYMAGRELVNIERVLEVYGVDSEQLPEGIRADFRRLVEACQALRHDCLQARWVELRRE